MIQCVLSTSISLHFTHPLAHFPPIPIFSWCLRVSGPSHMRKSTRPWKTQSAFWAEGLANELSYWNRKESTLICRKCSYGKPFKKMKKNGGGVLDRKLRVRIKKCDNVLSLQMYQFTRRWSRLHPFTSCFPFLSFFLKKSCSSSHYHS